MQGSYLLFWEKIKEVIMFSVIFVLGLLYHTYTDMKSMLLYDKVTLILAAVGLVRAWYEGQLFDAAYGAGIM